MRGKILQYDATGHFLDTLWWNDYQTGDMEPEDLLQLPDNTVLAVGDMSSAWDLYLYDVDGAYLGDWGDNSEELALTVKRIALSADGRVIAIGKVGYPNNKGFAALLKTGGQMIKHSEPIEDAYLNYCLIPFGDGFLACTETTGSNENHIYRFDADLNVADTDWAQGKEGSYRGGLLLGGN